MASLPARIHFEELAKLGNGRIEIALVTVGISKVVPNHRFLRRQTLGSEILGDGFVMSAQVMQQHSEIVVGLPKPRIECESLAISRSRSRPVALITQGDAHVVVNICIPGLTSQRLLEGTKGGCVLVIGVVAKPEIAIGFRISRIDAESSARFCNRIVAIVMAVVDVG